MVTDGNIIWALEDDLHLHEDPDDDFKCTGSGHFQEHN